MFADLEISNSSWRLGRALLPSAGTGWRRTIGLDAELPDGSGPPRSPL